MLFHFDSLFEHSQLDCAPLRAHIKFYSFRVLSSHSCKNDVSVHAEQYVQMLMDAVYQKTGITATGGIGTNLYLAKIAMDIIAKHVPSHIGYLDEKLYQEQLWHRQSQKNHKVLSMRFEYRNMLSLTNPSLFRCAI